MAHDLSIWAVQNTSKPLFFSKNCAHTRPERSVTYSVGRYFHEFILFTNWPVYTKVAGEIKKEEKKKLCSDRNYFFATYYLIFTFAGYILTRGGKLMIIIMSMCLLSPFFPHFFFFTFVFSYIFIIFIYCSYLLFPYYLAFNKRPHATKCFFSPYVNSIIIIILIVNLICIIMRK